MTSLRTNIEVLLAGRPARPTRTAGGCSPTSSSSREELTALVNDLIELARGDQPDGADRGRPARPDRRGGGRARAAQRARASTFEPQLDAGDRRGRRRAAAPRDQQPARQRRPPLAARRRPSRCTSTRSGVRVRDHGDGVDRGRPPVRVRPLLPRRATRAGSQGSGLGLAIVRQVAEQHGGTRHGGQRARRRRRVHDPPADDAPSVDAEHSRTGRAPPQRPCSAVSTRCRSPCMPPAARATPGLARELESVGAAGGQKQQREHRHRD